MSSNLRAFFQKAKQKSLQKGSPSQQGSSSSKKDSLKITTSTTQGREEKPSEVEEWGIEEADEEQVEATPSGLSVKVGTVESDELVKKVLKSHAWGSGSPAIEGEATGGVSDGLEASGSGTGHDVDRSKAAQSVEGVAPSSQIDQVGGAPQKPSGRIFMVKKTARVGRTAGSLEKDPDLQLSAELFNKEKAVAAAVPTVKKKPKAFASSNSKLVDGSQGGIEVQENGVIGSNQVTEGTVDSEVQDNIATDAAATFDILEYVPALRDFKPPFTEVDYEKSAAKYLKRKKKTVLNGEAGVQGVSISLQS